MRKCVSTVILVLLIALLMSLPADAADKPGGKVKAFVSILPIAYFVERVGGPNVEVSVSGRARSRSSYLRAHAQTHDQTG